VPAYPIPLIADALYTGYLLTVFHRMAVDAKTDPHWLQNWWAKILPVKDLADILNWDPIKEFFIFDIENAENVAGSSEQLPSGPLAFLLTALNAPGFDHILWMVPSLATNNKTSLIYTVSSDHELLQLEVKLKVKSNFEQLIRQMANDKASGKAPEDCGWYPRRRFSTGVSSEAGRKAQQVIDKVLGSGKETEYQEARSSLPHAGDCRLPGFFAEPNGHVVLVHET